MVPRIWLVGVGALLADSGTREAVAAILPGRRAEGHARNVCAAFFGGAGQQREPEDSWPRERIFEPPSDRDRHRTVVECAERGYEGSANRGAQAEKLHMRGISFLRVVLALGADSDARGTWNGDAFAQDVSKALAY